MYIKLDKEYEVKTTLGTIREIEKQFGRAFFDIIKSVTSMVIEEQMRLLYVGVHKANSDLTETAFADLCEDNMGMGDLMEYLEKYLYALQYPGLSEQEVQERLEKKLEKSRKLQEVSGKVG